MGANYIEKFDIIEDKNFVNKDIVDALNRNDEFYVTRQTSKHDYAPVLPAGAPRQDFALREGLIEGARAGALTGTPAGGGVLRWELERDPISIVQQTRVPTRGSSNLPFRPKRESYAARLRSYSTSIISISTSISTSLSI